MVWIYVSPSTSSGTKMGYMYLDKIPFYLTSLDTPLSGVKGNPGNHPSLTPLSAWSSVSACSNTNLISLCFDYCVDVTRSPACRKPFISQTLVPLSHPFFISLPSPVSLQFRNWQQQNLASYILSLFLEHSFPLLGVGKSGKEKKLSENSASRVSKPAALLISGSYFP